MDLKSLVIAGLVFSAVGCGHAGSTDTVKSVDEKVVELYITFAPPPTADVKKQRKTMLVKAGKAICSGAFVSPYGHIITARHCVDGATEIMVKTRDGQEYAASTRAISRTQDLAVIQIGKFGSPHFNLAQKTLERGQAVRIIGSPLGLTGTVTQGIVSKLGGDITFLDCTALPGNSGGPVINTDGELVGVVSAIIVVYLGPSHLSIVASIDAIRLFFYELSGGK